MELRNASVHCYRRFADPSNIRLNENLIAVVGTNEAGKSSFLDALEELNSDEPISEYDATRHKDCQPELSVTFKLDEDDQAKLSSIEGAENISEWTLTKDADGDLTVALDTTLPHNLEPRRNAIKSLENIEGIELLDDRGGRKKRKRRSSRIKKLQEVFRSDEDYLGDDTIETISKLGSDLVEVIKQSDESTEHDNEIIKVGQELKKLAEHEKQCPPHRARELLKQERPQFISFTEEDRQLKNQYDLEKHSGNYPDALENLAELADLDLDELLEAAENGDRPRVYTLTTDATRKLESEFSKSWVQKEVVPVIDIDDTVLHLHTQTQDEHRHSPIEDRSDGLRWFIALLAFLNTKDAGEDPVLLVDEAEQHLSYDAQASLIEVLESQDLANTVIYTTHSAGCLPSDLGRGIRPIIPDEDEEKSNIKNGFWREGEGFSPLMMAMGLSSFAFTVSRNVLIGEGPCECILLPSLIRGATGRTELKYQVAPGLSTADSDDLGDLLSESGRTAFIVDGDEAGNEYEEGLIGRGVDEEQIFSYNAGRDEPLVLEDLVDLEVYVEAVNEELGYWQSDSFHDIGEVLTPDNLPDHGRDNAVQEWCEEQGYAPVQKTTLAQRLADKAGSGEDIVNPARCEILVEIDRQAREYFDIE
ncbi:AAA ATPase domain-containing protein [Natronorubrum sediminis]|uniref:AAA ATPase domain-containing protein n=1 Tax=Natronorubrum sediminis TaxID=640943 RepID=A0A1H6FXX8_9EURY|nr:AAA family ATPase [Natronorubrum sediminis]SEH15028.1 AAA ATPase domain-containing protein [Natronorubrum sediminis]